MPPVRHTGSWRNSHSRSCARWGNLHIEDHVEALETRDLLFFPMNSSPWWAWSKSGGRSPTPQPARALTFTKCSAAVHCVGASKENLAAPCQPPLESHA